MSRLVFLLEEYSMKVLLDGLLPRLYPELRFLCVQHEGKQDLEKSVPRKLRKWRVPGDVFVVLRDNDGRDCHALKAKLTATCREGRREDTLVRIACQELEAWYLGEPEAMVAAFGADRLRRSISTRSHPDPDVVGKPSHEVARLVPEFQKVSGARRMAQHLSRERNRSRSFHALLSGIDRLTEQWASPAGGPPTRWAPPAGSEG